MGSRRPVGKVGETRSVFPGLSIGDRAGAVRRGSAQPTVHKFTAPPRHRVRRPVPSQPSIGRGKPRPVFASRAPDADVADYTSQKMRQGCASVRCRWRRGAGRPIRASRSTTSARRTCKSFQPEVTPCAVLVAAEPLEKIWGSVRRASGPTKGGIARNGPLVRCRPRGNVPCA